MLSKIQHVYCLQATLQFLLVPITCNFLKLIIESDMKSLADWFLANKLSLNVPQKVLFQPKLISSSTVRDQDQNVSLRNNVLIQFRNVHVQQIYHIWIFIQINW